MTPKFSNYVALLRGINLGARRMAMKDLAELCTGQGCSDVRTYIQSGNVVFAAPAAAVKRLRPALEKRIEEQFGFAVPVVVRSREQLQRVVDGNPFLKAGKPEKTLHVAFLADEPGAKAIAQLDLQRSAPDEFRVIRGEIYLYLPNGAGASKLTNAYFDAKLSTISTARNWATVLKLLAMCCGSAS
jgi:uncharacterized protein (DUF1697 family)